MIKTLNKIKMLLKYKIGTKLECLMKRNDDFIEGEIYTVIKSSYRNIIYYMLYVNTKKVPHIVFWTKIRGTITGNYLEEFGNKVLSAGKRKRLKRHSLFILFKKCVKRFFKPLK